MRRDRIFGALAAVLVCAWSTGCGTSDTHKPRPTGGARPAVAGGGLARPLYPTCGTAGYAKPVVKALESDGPGGGSTWSLQYHRAPSSAGQTMNVVIVEASPRSPSPKPTPGARVVIIKGRRVTVHPPPTPGAGFTAQWKTRRAQYAFVADGARGMETIRRFVPCLP